MCKGKIVGEIMHSHLEKQVSGEVIKFVYGGDGKNDFCAAKQLRNGDAVLARKEFTLEEYLKKHAEMVLCDIAYWKDYDEFAELVLRE